jgi:hypothetical protein
MANDKRLPLASAPLVAICAWILPGSGYFLIGQMGRAIVIGTTIILLFLAGILIAGVRVIEVPGFDVTTGEKAMTTLTREVVDPNKHTTSLQAVYELQVDPVTHQPILDANGQQKNVPARRWVLEVSVLGEIREKPWSVPQVLAGPMAIAAGWASVDAAHIDPETHKQKGAITHARINEIGSLYLSVAGLLNLMAIIDCTWRASHLREKHEEATA